MGLTRMRLDEEVPLWDPDLQGVRRGRTGRALADVRAVAAGLQLTLMDSLAHRMTE